MPNYKVVNADQLDADLKTLADSIRAKGGSEGELQFPNGMKEAVENIPAADTTTEDGLITGTLTSYTNDRVESLRKYAFYQYTTLKSVNLPNAKSIGYMCFHSCNALEAVVLPELTTMGDDAFNQCKGLKSIILPNLLQVPQSGFCSCSSLEKVEMPNVTALAYRAFESCSKLTEINMPSLESLSSSCFDSCVALEGVNLPKVKTTSSRAFYGCKKLKYVDFSAKVSLSSDVFYNSTILDTVILRSATACILSNTSAFKGTPFAVGGTGGVALVPTALVAIYETATNWSALYTAGTCTFLPLEEYTVDGTTTGEIDMAKVEAKLEELYGGAEV